MTLPKDFESLGLLALLLLICAPLSVSVHSTEDIYNSYSTVYAKTVDSVSDTLLDASESNPNSYVAQVVGSGIQGKLLPRLFDMGSTSMKRPLPPKGMSSTTYPFSKDGSKDVYRMEGNMMGGELSDASSTQMIQIWLSPGDIRALQQFLNQNGFAIAQSGPGSMGNESTNFGPKTIVAFRKFLEFVRNHPCGVQGGNMKMGGVGENSVSNNRGGCLGRVPKTPVDDSGMFPEGGPNQQGIQVEQGQQ